MEKCAIDLVQLGNCICQTEMRLPAIFVFFYKLDGW